GDASAPRLEDDVVAVAGNEVPADLRRRPPGPHLAADLANAGLGRLRIGIGHRLAPAGRAAQLAGDAVDAAVERRWAAPLARPDRGSPAIGRHAARSTDAPERRCRPR